MDSTLNRTSLRWGVPGLILQTLGPVVALNADEPIVDLLALLSAVAGTVMWLVGLGYYAQAKGQSQWWGLVGFVSILGIAVLVFLPDKLKPNNPSSR
jgi:hypothetical protein